MKGLYKIAAATPQLRLGDAAANAEEMARMWKAVAEILRRVAAVLFFYFVFFVTEEKFWPKLRLNFSSISYLLK